MTIDLGAILELAAPLAASAIATSGTTVTVTRPDPTHMGGTVDPDTLAVTGPGSTVVVTDAPAVVVPAGRQAPAPGGYGAPDPTPTAYNVLLLPDVIGPRAGDVVTVLTSRDARLVGHRFAVADVPDTFAGVVRTLVCEPLR